MRVTTAFNRLLRLPGAAVIDVSFSSEGVIADRPASAAPAGVRALWTDRPQARDPRSPDQALASSGSRRKPVRGRMPAASSSLP